MRRREAEFEVMLSNRYPPHRRCVRSRNTEVVFGSRSQVHGECRYEDQRATDMAFEQLVERRQEQEKESVRPQYRRVQEVSVEPLVSYDGLPKQSAPQQRTAQNSLGVEQ